MAPQKYMHVGDPTPTSQRFHLLFFRASPSHKAEESKKLRRSWTNMFYSYLLGNE